MKLNNKGFAITSIVYAILVLFLLLITSILLVLSNRELYIKKIKEDITSKYGIEDNWLVPDLTISWTTMTIPNDIDPDLYEIDYLYGVTATDSNGDVVNDITYELPDNYDPSIQGSYTITYTARDLKGVSTVLTRTVIVASIPSQIYKYTGNVQNVTLSQGNYIFQLWGASGGSLDIYKGTDNGGKGSYTKGEISLNENRTLYIYVGGKGLDITTPGTLTGTASGSTVISGGYNGGGAGMDEYDGVTLSGNETGAPGGGATDVRIISGNWDAADSLASRIMVAAGGSGSYNINGSAFSGKAGGGLASYHNNISYSATQTIGNGFGKGMNGMYFTHAGDWGTPGGGGGYYGGFNYAYPNNANGAYVVSSGGSSYISGHTGSIAIKGVNDTTSKNGCSEVIGSAVDLSGYVGTSDNNCSIHYSDIRFYNTTMIDGSGYSWTNVKGEMKLMPAPYGGYYSTGIGHSGNGYLKITTLPTYE